VSGHRSIAGRVVANAETPEHNRLTAPFLGRAPAVQHGLQNRARSGQHGGGLPYFGGMVIKAARLARIQKDPEHYRVPPPSPGVAPASRL